MSFTDDPNDQRLKQGVNSKPVPQNEVYLVLSEEERAKGFLRPVRYSYIHRRGAACGIETKMGLVLCETYARDPYFYGSTYCCGCSKHLPVAEFDWAIDGKQVGS